MNDYGAGEVMIEVLEKLYKKIPKRGLNNMTRQTYWWHKKTPNSESEWLPQPYYPEPTIKRRMDNLYNGGMFGVPYLPWQMVAMSSPESKEKAGVLLKKIFDELHSFTNKLDTVTVVEKDEIKEYKHRIQGLTRFLLKSGQILGIVLDAEFALGE